MGGYGFVASSEAEANTYLNFGCSAPEVALHLCNYYGTSIPEPSRVLTDVGRALVLQRVREAAFERLILDRAAANRDRSASWPASTAMSCINPGGTVRPPLANLYRALPAEQPSNEEVGDPLGNAASRLRISGNYPPISILAKFRAAGNVLGSGNMVRALLFYDQLNEVQRTRCTTAAQRAGSECVDVANQESRLERSYPAVLGTGVDRTAIKNALYDVLGARGSGTDAQRRARGRTRYSTGVEGWDLGELEKAIADNLGAGVTGDTGASTAVNGRLRTARDSLSTQVTALRDTYTAGLDAKATQVCGRSLEDFIRNDSNVVRQVFADATVQERGLMRAVLCENKFATAHRTDGFSCYGVTHATGSGGERVTRVARNDSGFPFSSGTFYEIVTPPTPPGGASTVRMTLKVQSSLPAAEADALRERMRTAAQNFFNCQTGGGTPPVTSLNVGTPPAFAAHGMPSVAACPPNGAAMQTPPMQFEIGFVAAPRPTAAERTQISNCEQNTVASAQTWSRCASLLPRISIHRCYNADLPAGSATDCAAAKSYKIGLCTRTVDMRRRAGAGSTANAYWGGNIDEYLDNVSQPSPDPVPSPSPNPARDAAVATATTACAALGGDDCAQARCRAGRLTARPPIHCFTDRQRDDLCENRVDRDTLVPNPPVGADGRGKSTSPPEGDASYNREDSGNYTANTDTPTVLHEVGHLVALPDEYLDPSYAFSPPGEHDSMMNGSGPNARFYPRHLQQILQPSISCPTGSGARP